MLYLNRVTLAGRLRGAPEVRYTPQGKEVVFFTLTFPSEVPQGLKVPCRDVSVRVMAKGGEGWMERAREGSNLLVEGGLMERYWRDDLGERVALEVVAQRVALILDPQGG